MSVLRIKTQRTVCVAIERKRSLVGTPTKNSRSTSGIFYFLHSAGSSSDHGMSLLKNLCFYLAYVPESLLAND